MLFFLIINVGVVGVWLGVVFLKGLGEIYGVGIGLWFIFFVLLLDLFVKVIVIIFLLGILFFVFEWGSLGIFIGLKFMIVGIVVLLSVEGCFRIVWVFLLLYM